VKILVVCPFFPWPETSGGRLRIANIIRSLALAGEVDVFCIVSPGERRDDGKEATSLSADEPIARLGIEEAPSLPARPAQLIRWFARDRLPYEIARRDHAAARASFVAWSRPRYDLVWMQHAESYVALGGLTVGRSVVDLDDLEDRKITGRLVSISQDRRRLRWRERAILGPASHSWGLRVHARLNQRRWRALQGRITRAANTVVVCSALDHQRLAGSSNIAVIPNGYRTPERPVGRVRVADPPTLLLAGALTYTPNADAARYFVQRIAPLIRSRIPRIRVRLVGNYNWRVADLAREGVTLTGRVPDMAEELAMADLVVVPIRFGSGTRVKILEAFAHGIPVVSSSLGCEGLDLADRQHLLIADDPHSFASACIELMTDTELRARLIDAARGKYRAEHRWEVIQNEIVDLATQVARSPGTRPGDGTSVASIGIATDVGGDR
jgi:glycosyltransferase involved in cell wall biosynthesis